MSAGADRAVWEAVRRGDRSGTALSPGVVFARTGVRVTGPEMNAAIGRLLAGGHLFWRGARVHRRLLAGLPLTLPSALPSAVDQPSLFADVEEGCRG